MSEPATLTSAQLKRAKRDLRRATLLARDAIEPAARARFAAAMTRRFLALPEVEAARTVMAFWSFGSEIPTAPLITQLNARGVVVALPQIVEGEMWSRRYEPGDQVTETPFGAFEPSHGDPVEPVDIDVIATPSIAFDRVGGRVGYGGGFYDRFFPRARADCLRAGVALGVQVLAPGERVPGGHFDMGVDVIVTESETVRCPRQS